MISIVKKVCILFVSCMLWVCLFGQGTVYIKKCNIQGYSQIIRDSPNTIGQILNCRGSGEAIAPICH